MAKKLVLLAVLATAIFGYFYFGLNQSLTLDAFRARQAEFATQYAANPALFLGGFFALYVAVTALSVPGAAILTMAAGALFGLTTGTLLVSFASSIGATLAFLSSRYLLRDWVQTKFGARLKAIDGGFERDGAFYLFTLRMIPAFPFFVVNLVMGLTKIRTFTYYWVSQLGMLAGTLVFVNAGTELARIKSTAGLLTPTLLGSFLALAIFPWIAKAVIGWLNARKVYSGYKRPKSFDRNLIVIGAGSAGLVASYIAAMVKAKVTLIEANEMGGDCLNTGCVPSKALIKSAGRAFDIADAARFGVMTGQSKVDFPAVMARVNAVINAIEPHDSVARFTGLGVECVSGYAKFLDPWTVEIAIADGQKQRLTGRDFIIATGAAPFIPALPGLSETPYLTSENLWAEMAKRKSAPKRLLILGGGPIGCELAQAFQRLGSKVSLVEMADVLLAKEDKDASELIAARLRAEGVNLLLGHTAIRIENGKKLITSSTNGVSAVPFDDIIIAVGRRARVSGFGLEELGLVIDGKLANDDYLSSNMPHIRVAGDVAGRQQLTHGASHEAWYAAVNALARPFKSYRADYRVLPRVTYTAPEVAHVGITEAEAIAQNLEYDVTRYDLDDLDRAIAESEAYGFVKILTEKNRDRILGATVVGAHAGETIAELVLAMRHNLGLGKIMATIHSYPTWAEANKYAAGQYRLARKPEMLLIWAERWFRWRRG
jgi:pyruvate/2-oxoglutarate dehydrogenase complex dihydrolipoamide dehydrogenase (E3) component/uncharacterized membrane protein YdjX (TVP38/TMEM64 family)